MLSVPLVGNTIRVDVEFKTFSGTYQDPSDLTLQVYDDQYNKIGEEIQLGSAYRIGTGMYRYYYAIPEDIEPGQILYLEFKGNLEGLPIVGRYLVHCEWI